MVAASHEDARVGPRADRVRAGILEAATDLVAERGSDVSMAALADAAGVGRATLYRYFPTRESLVEALVVAAIAEAEERLASAGLDDVPFAEAVARTARALLTVGRRYVVLVQERRPEKGCHAAPVRARVQALMSRGQREGALDPALPVSWLGDVFGGLVLAAIGLLQESDIGVEDAAALVTAQFLSGARAS